MITNGSLTALARRARRASAISVVCLAVTWASASALAGDAGFYSGGKFHPVIVSETEFAVELDDTVERSALSRQLRESAVGTLEAVPWAGPNARVAILRTTGDAAATRSRLRHSGGVHSFHHVYRFEADGPPILSSGCIVLQLRSEIDDAERQAMFEDYRLELIEHVAGLPSTYLVRPCGDIEGVELDTANALYHDDRTMYAHPDLRMPVVRQQVGGIGSETFSNQQWHLQNDGTLGGTPDQDINISPAWNRSRGAAILLGQLDDACDVNHEDLFENYLGMSQNIVNNSQSVSAADPKNADDRHGTATMGVMVALENDVGVVGVAPLAQFTASRGVTDAATSSQVASAYTFARNMDVDVHNNSWGFTTGAPVPDVIADALQTAFDEGRNGLGMVICFASGNGAGMDEDDPEAVEVEDGDELATLQTVIGVGACNADGDVATYSNFGRSIDVLAPSNDFPGDGSTLPSIVTTDNTDGVLPNDGYNEGGFFGDRTDLADTSYTRWFGGTSASSAQVSGLAALILAIEPEFTATMVRTTIEHTCDKIPDQASYNGITGRSLRHGYGRINAGVAVEATYDGYYWPARLADVRVENKTIYWDKNENIRTIGTQEFGVRVSSILVVEADTPFDWTPLDSTTYLVGQVVEPTSGAKVVANLNAGQYTFGETAADKYYGVYSVTITPRRGATYGFGVSVVSDGTVIDSGIVEDTGGGELPPGSSKPSVSIEVKPLAGVSPLQVTFVGNVQSENEIPDGGYLWDFGDGVTSTQRNSTHTYTVASGTRRFFPRLTVTDVEGNVGQRSVAVDVSATDTDGTPGNTARVTIRITDPNSGTTNISSGFAPLGVLLSAEIEGDLDGDATAIFWDLGDGNFSTSLSVIHTYQVPGTFPITVQVAAEELDAPLQATRFLSVLEDPTASPTPTPTATPDPNNGNGSLFPCGTGTAVAFWAMGAFVLLRRMFR